MKECHQIIVFIKFRGQNVVERALVSSLDPHRGYLQDMAGVTQSLWLSHLGRLKQITSTLSQSLLLAPIFC